MAYRERAIRRGKEEAGVDEPWSSGALPAPPPSGYEPPPAFAPPVFRVAPLNETQVLGGTSYPHLPYAQPLAYPAPYGPSPYPPVAWHPSITWQPTQHDSRARRHRLISIGTVAALVVALGAIAAVLVSGAGGRHMSRSLSLPESVDEYSRISTISGAQLRGLFTGTFATMPIADLEAAKVAVYDANDKGQPSLVFIGFSAQDSPSVGAQLHTEPADDVAADVLNSGGASSPPVKVDAGPLGGALKCAHVDVGGEDAIAGVWADHDTLGIVLIVDSTGTTSHTSAVTRDFRAKAEH